MNINLSGAMYETIPDVAELNSVKGFDPRKFMRRTVSEETKQEVYYLDLKFKKLWFRLAHPAGRIKTTVLKITNQLAIIEAKVYYDKNDREPAASFVAQRTLQDKAGTLYIEAAQYAAVDQALCDAGFGLQFCDVSQGPDPELYDSGIPAVAVSAAAAGQPSQPKQEAAAPDPSKPDKEFVCEAIPPASPAEEPVRKPDAPSAPAVEAVQENDPPAAPASELERSAAVEETAVQTPIGIAEDPAPAPSEEVPIQDQPPVGDDPALESREELVSDSSTTRYSPDMTADEIYALMTPEEAATIISDVGNMAGQTLEAIAQRRPAVLKWYINGCNSSNNILRAGARIMLEQVMGQKLAS